MLRTRNNEPMTDGFYMTLQCVFWLKPAQYQKLPGNRSSVLGGYVVVVLPSGALNTQ